MSNLTASSPFFIHVTQKTICYSAIFEKASSTQVIASQQPYLSPRTHISVEASSVKAFV